MSETATPALSKLTKDQIIEQLQALGEPHNPNDKKAELLTLLTDRVNADADTLPAAPGDEEDEQDPDELPDNGQATKVALSPLTDRYPAIDLGTALQLTQDVPRQSDDGEAWTQTLPLFAVQTYHTHATSTGTVGGKHGPIREFADGRYGGAVKGNCWWETFRPGRHGPTCVLTDGPVTVKGYISARHTRPLSADTIAFVASVRSQYERLLVLWQTDFAAQQGPRAIVGLREGAWHLLASGELPQLNRFVEAHGAKSQPRSPRAME